MKVCITGALGHIGSALIRSLALPRGSQVRLVDNLATNRYASLFELPPNLKYQFYAMDILSAGMESVIQSSDVVIHLAALTDAESSVRRPDAVEEVNVKGLENVATMCSRYSKPLIFPSTTSVYGISSNIVEETCSDEDMKPQSPYAESKIQGENYLRQLGTNKNLSFVILRIGTIMGFSVGMRFHTVVNKFVWQACLNSPLTVWKTALHQKRPYCDLSDLISALNYILEQKLFDNEIYNIVTSNLTVNDIIDIIRQYIPELTISLVDSAIMNQLSYEVSNIKSIQNGFTYSGSAERCIADTIAKLRNANTIKEELVKLQNKRGVYKA